MYSHKTIDKFIYNNNGEKILKLSSYTIFTGNHSLITNTYDYFEIWLMQSQQCNIQTSKESYSLYQGDILIFSQNDDNEIIYSDNNALFLILQIDVQTFSQLIPYSALFTKYNFFNSHSENFHNKVIAANPVAQTIKSLLSIIVEEFAEEHQGYELNIMRSVIDILLTVARETNYCTNIEHSEGNDKYIKTHKSLKKALDYIDSHITDELTLEKISSIANLSPNYLSNIFREQTGMKLWDYIGEKRIHLATQLLIENPNDSIISVALKCGFNNCPNFNRAFKKYTGQTPKNYKTYIMRQEENL